MAMFDYTGRDATGQLTTGTIDALDASAAARQLKARNVIPINIAQASVAQSSTRAQEIKWYTPKVKLDDLVIFARQMYSLTKSGIPILRAVNGLADTTNSPRMKVALYDVAEQLERGRTLSTALNIHADIFSQLFVAIVHVGENTGRLDQAFLQLSEYLEREQETRKQIKTATRYPTFVVIALVIAMVIMNVMVIPIFASMFDKFGAELPLATRFLLGMSDAFIQYWPHMLAIVTVAIIVLRRYLQTPKGRYFWDRRKIKLPIVGSIFERSLLGRFARSFSMMLNAGVPLTTGLNLTAEAVDNAYMADLIITMRRNIERGESLSRVAQSSGMFTPLVMQMINVGEETGQIDEMLQEAAEFYEREVDYDLKSLTAKIEPILISVVAVMVAVLALGIFTPMWDMMGAYTGRR
ncbi:type II secretion system F family protein [Aestuariibacter salexigens]|uniref:type II secretion system F family protein n=1 Tax=Aestuariibacter salexigens TaxID=226010 RepID=UPI00040A2B36|nr:type II secretion system F family protein [Aestuariibacter salexigens]